MYLVQAVWTDVNKTVEFIFISYWYYLSFWKFRNFYNLSIFSKIKWWSDRQLIESNRIWMLLNPLWTFINFVSQPIFFDYCSYSDTVKIFLFYCLSASGWLQLCWWQLHVDDLMMVTDIRCWWQNKYFGDFFVIEYIWSITITFCLQYPSPTSTM